MSAVSTASTITVNDQPRPFPEGGRLAELVSELGLAERKGIAVAINGMVVPKSEWPCRALAAADRVLIIQATQGG